MSSFDLARTVYQSAGYGGDFGPHPRRLKLRTDLVLGPLIPGEAEFRQVSDDRAIVTGYAWSMPGTGFLPSSTPWRGSWRTACSRWPGRSRS